MPVVRWGGKVGQAADDWDREEQRKPYAGPPVPNALYYWDIKVLKYRQGANFPQLMIGIELVPRTKARPEEKRYKGYFIFAFLPIADHVAFRYAPFLDAIGVSGADLEKRCRTDNEGNVTSIGKWRKKASGNYIAADLTTGKDDQGNPRQEVNSFYAIAETTASEEEEEEEYEEDDSGEEYEEDSEEEGEEEQEYEESEEEEGEEEEEEEEEQPAPPPRRPAKKAAKKAAARPLKRTVAKKTTAKKATRRAVEPDDDEPPF